MIKLTMLVTNAKIL